MKKLFLCFCFLVIGCAPVIISSAPGMVILGNSGKYNVAESLKLAEEECQKYGRHAVYMPDAAGRQIYECKK